MKIPHWLCRTLAGYGDGNTSACFTAGWCIGTDTRRGRFVLWCIDTLRAIRGQPSDFKYWLADLLSRGALRLRGDATPKLFGYYEDTRGNRAAELADRITFDLILARPLHNLEDERMNQIHEQVRELASLARSTWHWQRQPKE
jgi:hypothetical protein